MRKIYITFLIIIYSFISYSQTDSLLVEFRGAWVATAKMIDYPSKRGLTSEQLKNEFIALLDLHQQNGMNAILFQIRPASDAFYDSPYEPWSEWLTGVQNKAPSPYFDPLEFMIDETHKRGMEFHAWFNPFRSVATIQYADICNEHVSVTNPDWNFTYGINKYLNPGIPEVREFVTKIIADVVTRYNIDGVHFDDYYYPYPEKDSTNTIISIPDNSAFTKYKGSFTDIKDWRRNNMDLFVQMVHDTIKSIKPDVVFGVSPPGVWRNKGYDPEGSNTLGLACYDYLYADILNWLKNDWIDYVTPQIYWYIGNKNADFSHLVDWWSNHNYGKNLYIGIGVYNIDKTGQKAHWSDASEVPNQIRLARQNSQVKGFMFYKTQTFRDNPLGINDSLRNNLFKVPAVASITFKNQIAMNDFTENEIIEVNEIETSTTVKIIDKTIPETPKNVDVIKIKNEITIYWDNVKSNPKNSKDSVAYYNIYKYKSTDNKDFIFDLIYTTSKENKILIENSKGLKIFAKKYLFVITAVDCFENESEPSSPVMIRLKK